MLGDTIPYCKKNLNPSPSKKREEKNKIQNVHNMNNSVNPTRENRLHLTGHRPVGNNSKRKIFHTAGNGTYPDPCRSWQLCQTFLHAACWQNGIVESSLSKISASTPRICLPQAGLRGCPCHRGRQSSSSPARTNAWTTARYRPTRTSSTSKGTTSTLEVLGRGSLTSSSDDESDELSELLVEDSKKSGGCVSDDSLNWNHWKSNWGRDLTNFSKTTLGSTIGAWLPRCCAMAGRHPPWTSCIILRWYVKDVHTTSREYVSKLLLGSEWCPWDKRCSGVTFSCSCGPHDNSVALRECNVKFNFKCCKGSGRWLQGQPKNFRR